VYPCIQSLLGLLKKSIPKCGLGVAALLICSGGTWHAHILALKLASSALDRLAHLRLLLLRAAGTRRIAFFGRLLALEGIVVLETHDECGLLFVLTEVEV